MKSFMRIWMLLFCGIPGIILIVGVFLIYFQKQKIDTFVAVDAVVLSASVDTVISTDKDGHTSTSYQPLIHYAYEIDGQAYDCDVAFPLGNSSASRAWANSIVQKFPKGKRVTAYYNPAQRDDAFLIRELSYFPYAFAQFPMLFWLIAALVWIYLGGGGREVKPPTSRPGGGFFLRPKRSLSRRCWLLLGVTIFWYSLGGLTAGHYLAFASRYEMLMYIALPILSALGLIPAGLFVYNRLLANSISEPIVVTESNRFYLNSEFSVLVILPVKTEVKINELQIGLVCECVTKRSSGGKTSYSTNRDYEDTEILGTDRQMREGERVSGTHAFVIPADRQPSNANEHPLWGWYIEVRLNIAGRPDYRGHFPIKVEPSNGG
jgi:hypothetical protein